MINLNKYQYYSDCFSPDQHLEGLIKSQLENQEYLLTKRPRVYQTYLNGSQFPVNKIK